MSERAFDSRGALEAVDRILNRGGAPEEVLAAVLDALHTRGVPYARISLSTGAVSAVGAQAPATNAEIVYASERVGMLEVAIDDEAFVERVATLVSAVSAERAEQSRTP